MLIFYSAQVQKHSPAKYFQMGFYDDYPESPSRMDSILNAIEKRKWKLELEIKDFGMDPILKIHSKNYIEYLESAYEIWAAKGGNENGVLPDTFACTSRREIFKDILNGKNSDELFFHKHGFYAFDTAGVIAKETFKAAYEAAQVTLTAAEQLIATSSKGIFALVRPPGHHSAAEMLGGFCFINNAAVAAQYLIDHHAAHVCILGKCWGFIILTNTDVDYHHGNGTQEIFYSQSNPLFVSLHGQDDYPFYWGFAEEKGQGQGEGFNVNVGLPIGTEDDEYVETLEKTIQTHVLPYGASHLVVSLGVDTAAVDPVGKFGLSANAFIRIGQAIRKVGLPTLFVFEGGYAVAELGDNVCNVLQGFEL